MIWALLAFALLDPATIESDEFREVVRVECEVATEGVWARYGDGWSVVALEWTGEDHVTLGPEHDYTFRATCEPQRRRRGREVVEGPAITQRLTALTRATRHREKSIARYELIRGRRARLGDTRSVLLWVGLDRELTLRPGDVVVCCVETTCEPVRLGE